MNENIRKTFFECVKEVVEIQGLHDIEDMDNDTVLLKSGLDSLSFATIVVLMEKKLGFDPFTESDESFYPQTVADFCNFYEEHNRKL